MDARSSAGVPSAGRCTDPDAFEQAPGQGRAGPAGVG